ncbi:RAPGEF2 family protein [Megaselia abdita]
MNENLENKSKMFSNNPANPQSELFFSEKKPKNRSSLAVSDDTMSFSSYSSFSSISTTNRAEGEREMDGECVEGEEVDLSGLVESVVDDDDSDEEDLAESMESLTTTTRTPRTIRDCLEKDPTDRTDADLTTLLELTHTLKAFQNTTHSIRRALCSVMVFAVVDSAGTTVLSDGEELDSWSVLINGVVEVEEDDNSEKKTLEVGDSFGILPTMDKFYHKGTMRTKTNDCQFVCITQNDYYRILSQGEENIRRHEDQDGRTVLVTEARGRKNRQYVIRGTVDELIEQLVVEGDQDGEEGGGEGDSGCYIDDFLLTHRTFVESRRVFHQLLEWFRYSNTTTIPRTYPSPQEIRDRVTRVILLWVNNHFADFEIDGELLSGLEIFDDLLYDQKMFDQRGLLYIACTAKAKPRTLILARTSREENLNFTLVSGGGSGTPGGIFVSDVIRGSRAEEIGLKRGDQILAVNGGKFERNITMTVTRAYDLLKQSTHVKIEVRSCLLVLKRILSGEKIDEVDKNGGSQRFFFEERTDFEATPKAPAAAPPTAANTPSSGHQNFLTLGPGPKKRLQKALAKISILQATKPTPLPHSRSNPDLTAVQAQPEVPPIPALPDHVIRVYRPDHQRVYLPINRETTAREVVMLSLREFAQISENSTDYSLFELVSDNSMVKQRKLPDQLSDLAERATLVSRYFLKKNSSTEQLSVPADDMTSSALAEILQLDSGEMAIQLAIRDFEYFRVVEGVEFVGEVLSTEKNNIKCSFGNLEKFSKLVNEEMFWVVSEIVRAESAMKRAKIIKQFIKIARFSKEKRNFNCFFAVLSGLGHGAVGRLRSSWEKVPGKYLRVFREMEELMDPSRNMGRYRQLISAELLSNHPIVPFYPIVKKDLTFIHLGNDSKVDGLVNFEKLRMIAKEIRILSRMASAETGGCRSDIRRGTFGGDTGTTTSGPTLTAPLTLVGTMKRRKKSTASSSSTSAPANYKKMFEEAQMVKRVKFYLENVKIIEDEDVLHNLSLECEPPNITNNSSNNHFGGSGSISGGSTSAPSTTSSTRKTKNSHRSSPTLSTTSSTSSTSEGRKMFSHSGVPAYPKFGTASPQAVKKMLSLSETSKTRPHQQPPQLPQPQNILRHYSVPGMTTWNPAQLSNFQQQHQQQQNSQHSQGGNFFSNCSPSGEFFGFQLNLVIFPLSHFLLIKKPDSVHSFKLLPNPNSFLSTNNRSSN